MQGEGVVVNDKCSDEGVYIVDLEGEGVGAAAAHLVVSMFLHRSEGGVELERVMDIVEGVGVGAGSAHLVVVYGVVGSEGVGVGVMMVGVVILVSVWVGL